LAVNYRLGKLSPRFFQRIIYPKLGVHRSSVVNGPKKGGDSAAIRLDKSRLLVATSDPLSYIPSIGATDSAFLSVHLLASDITTSGFPPQYGIFDFNLPKVMSDREFAKYWTAFDSECKNLGISIIGGHTGRYLGEGDTIIGGGVLISIGLRHHYLSSSMVWPNDDLVLTKGAAIETTAVLTRSFPKVVRKTLGPMAFESAWKYLRMVTTVQDSLTAVSVGKHERGVTAMHDATEGGVLSACAELAEASKVGVRIDLNAIRVSEETQAVCKLFRLDPLWSLSEGSLLIASRPHSTETILKRLSQKRISANVIGRFSRRFHEMRIVTHNGIVKHAKASRDRYWAAYSTALSKGWS